MSEKVLAVVAVYLVVNKGEETLLYLRQNTGYCDGEYHLIAGHVDPEEPAIDAMIREAKEEANMDLMPDNLKPLCTMFRKSESPRIDIFYELVNYSGPIENNEPCKCKEMKFFKKNSLPENIGAHIKHVFEKVDEGEIFFDYNWHEAKTSK